MNMMEATERLPNDSESAFNDQFLLFLIAKYLKNISCTHAAQTLEDELREKNLLGSNLDWRGIRQPASLNDFRRRFPSVLDSHLKFIIDDYLSENKKSLIGPANPHKHGNLSIHDYTVLKHDIRSRCYIKNVFESRFKRRGKFNGHLAHAVYTIKFDRSGQYFITGADDCLVKVWNVATCQLVHTLRGHFNVIMDIAVSYDNTFLATAGADHLVRIWCLQTGIPVTVLCGHRDIITAVVFMNSSNILVSSSDDGTVRSWNLQPLSNVIFANKETRVGCVPCHHFEMGQFKVGDSLYPVRCISCSPVENIIVAGHMNGAISLWNYEIIDSDGGLESMFMNTKLLKHLLGHPEPVTDISFSGRGDRFITGSSLDGYVQVRFRGEDLSWNKSIALEVFSDKDIAILSAKNRRMKSPLITLDSIIWSCDDSKIITSHSIRKTKGLFEQRIKVFDSISGKLHFSSQGHQSSANIIAHPNQPNIICSVGQDGETRLWNLDLSIGSPQTCLFTNTFEGGPVSTGVHLGSKVSCLDAAFSPDGLTLVITDKCGCWSIFGTGNIVKVVPVDVAAGARGIISKDALNCCVPYEQYFSNDYKDIQLDANLNIIDIETQLPVGKVPKGILVASSGQSYVENFQRDPSSLLGPFPLSQRELDSVRREILLRQTSSFMFSARYSTDATNNDMCDDSDILQSDWTKSPNEDKNEHSVTFGSGNESGDDSVVEENAPSESFGECSSDHELNHSEVRRSERIEASGRFTHRMIPPINGAIRTRSQCALPDTSETARSRGSIDMEEDAQSDRDNGGFSPLCDLSDCQSEASAHFILNNLPKKKNGKIKKTPRNPLHQSVPLGTHIDRSWLLETTQSWISGTYCPQMGDSVVYIPQGHESHLFPDDLVLPVRNIGFFQAALCLVVGIEYGFPKGKDLQKCRSVIAKVSLNIQKILQAGIENAKPVSFLQPTSNFEPVVDTEKVTVYLRDDGQPDYLILRECYDAAVAVDWKFGMRVSSAFIIGGELVTSEGAIIEVSESNPLHWPQSAWEVLQIQWDLDDYTTQETEISRLSPWEVSTLKLTKNEIVTCDFCINRAIEVLQCMSGKKHSRHFLEPVDFEAVPSYPSLIPVPMDISLITRRLQGNYYRSREALRFDAHLICKNCISFNGPESIYARDAQKVMADFECLFEQILGKNEQESNTGTNVPYRINAPSETSQCENSERAISFQAMDKRKRTKYPNRQSSESGSVDTAHIITNEATRKSSRIALKKRSRKDLEEDSELSSCTNEDLTVEAKTSRVLRSSKLRRIR